MDTTTADTVPTATGAIGVEPADVAGMGMADVWALARRIDGLAPDVRDAVVERVWDDAEDVPVDYPGEDGADDGTDPDGELAEDYGIFPKGTPRIDGFWNWVDRHHSKGVGYIMCERRHPYAYERA